jgi:hypothetical protein
MGIIPQSVRRNAMIENGYVSSGVYRNNLSSYVRGSQKSSIITAYSQNTSCHEVRIYDPEGNLKSTVDVTKRKIPEKPIHYYRSTRGYNKDFSNAALNKEFPSE